MDYSREGRHRIAEQHEAVRACEYVRERRLEAVKKASGPFDLERAFDNLCGAHINVVKSRAKLNELMQP